ncbi:hypothetical protein O6H91_Y576800 [Diphasiastrum complanatum]|nr:hypothetical protein O6H91_Y576800 [Diphasiastrum complanatum]
MLDPDEKDASAMPLTARAVFIVEMSSSSCFEIPYTFEVLRVLDLLQLTAKYSIATPVDWKSGDKCMTQMQLKMLWKGYCNTVELMQETRSDGGEIYPFLYWKKLLKVMLSYTSYVEKFSS